MGFKLLAIVLLIDMVVARIRLDVKIDKNNEVGVSYTGSETRIVTDEDINLFKIGNENLLSALEKSLGRRPENAYVKSPTPWGDLFKSYNWEPVKRVLTVKSAKVIKLERTPIQVLSQDSINPSKVHNFKMNLGISRQVQNTMTTTSSQEGEFGVSQDIDYEVNVGVASAGGTTGFSFTATVGTSEEKSLSETIGTTSNVEIELKPGEAVTAVLTAMVGHLEIEVEYEASLRGTVATSFSPQYRGHYFHQVPIEILYLGDIQHVVTTKETIRINYYTEVQLKVYDRDTGVAI